MAILPPTLHVLDLRCERRTEPMGVDVRTPRLSWRLEGLRQDRRQSAFEIRAGTRPGSGDLWKTDKILSDESTGIAFPGQSLKSSQRVYWQVRVWDEHSRPSPWSAPSTWTMGILRPEDWKAHWISHREGTPPVSLLLRRGFQVRPGLVRALVHVTGLGQYELELNGRKVGNDVLSPGWTNYRKTVLYDTYDVTKMLKAGSNAAGILLGNGMDNVQPGRYVKFVGTFGPQRAIAQIYLEYRDGAVETVGTDRHWSVHPGPITFSNVYGGEDFDFRRLPVGWSSPGFINAWPPAREMEGPGGTLRGVTSAAPPIRRFETVLPKKTIKIREGVEVVDLGQNASYMLDLKATGPAGSFIRVIPAELLNPDGTVDRLSVGGGNAWWQVTLGPDGRADYASKFFYQGCRYLQVERYSSGEGELPKVTSIEGRVVQADAPAVGEFECSDELFNRIHRLIRWAQRSNLVSVLTDCPHRERLGWLEQYHLNGPSLRYEHDLSTLFAKGMQDMADSQRPDGLVPDIAPEYTVFDGGFVDSPEWGSAAVLVPWQQYQFHRDSALLVRDYETMKRYVEYLRSKSKDGIVSHGLGDWYDLGPGAPGYAQLTPIPLTATAFYYQDTVVLADVACILGKTKDTDAFRAEAKRIRDAFNLKFFDPSKGFYATGSQTSNAIPLAMGLVDSAHRDSVLAQLVHDVQSRGNAITAGDVGYRYVLRALADGGRSDVVFAMNHQSERPGYGYQLKKGATSLTEAWDANPSSSQNHFMLGQLMEWFYHDLAGIQPDDGFHRFVLRPTVVSGLSWARASYVSEYGRIESGWRREGEGVVFSFTVPPNSSAVVRLPGSESDQSLGAEIRGHETSRTIGSGHYEFFVPHPVVR